MDRRGFWWVLGAVVLAGAALRLCALGVHSFWFDEVVAMRIATAPTLAEMFARLAKDDMVGAPLHPLLLRAWTAAWGTSEGAGRGLSAAFSILGLVAMAAASWQAFRSRRAVLVATGLLAACPLDVAYAMENRMYSMLVFWTIAAWGLLFSFRRGRSAPREAAFGACLVALAYTHSLGGFMILALAAGYCVDRRWTTLPPRRWLLIQAAAFAAILPWAGRYLDHPPDPRGGFDVASCLFLWPAYAIGLPAQALPILAGGVALAWARPARTAPPPTPGGGERLRTALMLVAWAAGPLALMFAYSMLRQNVLGAMRYQLFLVPGVLLLIAGAAAFRPILAGGCLAVLVPLCVLPSLRPVAFDAQRKPEWREAARAILARSTSPTIVLSAPEPHMYYRTIDYYLPAGTSVISLKTFGTLVRGGTLDARADYWLLQDDLRRDARASEWAPWAQGEALDFGRASAVRLRSVRVAVGG